MPPLAAFRQASGLLLVLPVQATWPFVLNSAQLLPAETHLAHRRA
jgi:hypothetical protein